MQPGKALGFVGILQRVLFAFQTLTPTSPPDLTKLFKNRRKVLSEKLRCKSTFNSCRTAFRCWGFCCTFALIWGKSSTFRIALRPCPGWLRKPSWIGWTSDAQTGNTQALPRAQIQAEGALKVPLSARPGQSVGLLQQAGQSASVWAVCG
jgi:hypothetical protein